MQEKDKQIQDLKSLLGDKLGNLESYLYYPKLFQGAPNNLENIFQTEKSKKKLLAILEHSCYQKEMLNTYTEHKNYSAMYDLYINHIKRISLLFHEKFESVDMTDILSFSIKDIVFLYQLIEELNQFKKQKPFACLSLELFCQTSLAGGFVDSVALKEILTKNPEEVAVLKDPKNPLGIFCKKWLDVLEAKPVEKNQITPLIGYPLTDVEINCGLVALFEKYNEEESLAIHPISFFPVLAYEQLPEHLPKIVGSQKFPRSYLGIYNTQSHYVFYSMHQLPLDKLVVLVIDPLFSSNEKLASLRQTAFHFQKMFPRAEILTPNITQAFNREDSGISALHTAAVVLNSLVRKRLNAFLTIRKNKLFINPAALIPNAANDESFASLIRKRLNTFLTIGKNKLFINPAEPGSNASKNKDLPIILRGLADIRDWWEALFSNTKFESIIVWNSSQNKCEINQRLNDHGNPVPYDFEKKRLEDLREKVFANFLSLYAKEFPPFNNIKGHDTEFKECYVKFLPNLENYHYSLEDKQNVKQYIDYNLLIRRLAAKFSEGYLKVYVAGKFEEMAEIISNLDNFVDDKQFDIFKEPKTFKANLRSEIKIEYEKKAKKLLFKEENLPYFKNLELTYAMVEQCVKIFEHSHPSVSVILIKKLNRIVATAIKNKISTEAVVLPDSIVGLRAAINAEQKEKLTPPQMNTLAKIVSALESTVTLSLKFPEQGRAVVDILTEIKDKAQNFKQIEEAVSDLVEILEAENQLQQAFNTYKSQNPSLDSRFFLNGQNKILIDFKNFKSLENEGKGRALLPHICNTLHSIITAYPQVEEDNKTHEFFTLLNQHSFNAREIKKAAIRTSKKALAEVEIEARRYLVSIGEDPTISKILKYIIRHYTHQDPKEFAVIKNHLEDSHINLISLFNNNEEDFQNMVRYYSLSTPGLNTLYDGTTLLIRAYREDKFDLIKFLVERGVDINIRATALGVKDLSVWDIAFQEKKLRGFEALLSSLPEEIREAKAKEILIRGCKSGDIDIFTEILKPIKDIDYLTSPKEGLCGLTLIKYAEYRRLQEFVNRLQDKDPNIFSQKEKILLHPEGKSPLHLACKQQEGDLVDGMLSLAEKRDNSFALPLHDACVGEDTNIVETLLKSYPDTIRAKMHTGDTPVHLAFRNANVSMILTFMRSENFISSEVMFIKNNAGRLPVDELKSNSKISLTESLIFSHLYKFIKQAKSLSNNENRIAIYNLFTDLINTEISEWKPFLLKVKNLALYNEPAVAALVERLAEKDDSAHILFKKSAFVEVLTFMRSENFISSEVMFVKNNAGRLPVDELKNNPEISSKNKAILFQLYELLRQAKVTSNKNKKDAIHNFFKDLMTKDVSLWKASLKKALENVKTNKIFTPEAISFTFFASSLFNHFNPLEIMEPEGTETAKSVRTLLGLVSNSNLT